MKKILLVMLVLVAQALYAKSLPEIPGDCFDNDIFCNDAKVTKKKIDGEQKQVIHVEFFAKLDPAEFGESDDILFRFLDFNYWDNYVAGSSFLQYYETVALDSVMIDDQEVFRHYCHYWTKAPFIGKQEVYEQALYREVFDYDGVVFSWFFSPDPTFKKAKGIKYKEGYLHLTYDEDEGVYYAYVIIDVIPDFSFSIALHLAAPYVEDALVEVFKGMFGLN